MFGVSAGPPTRFFHVFILDIEIPQILNFTFFAYGLGLGRRIWNGFESVRSQALLAQFLAMYERLVDMERLWLSATLDV